MLRLVTILFIFSCFIDLDAQTDFESSNLPIVIIDTDDQNIPNRYKITADMGIIYNGPGVRNFITDSLNNYNGKIGIELRGSSSLNFPKKQYAVETRDETGNNLNVSLLGLPEENDWILYAPYSDKSLMRNVFLYTLSNKIGRYASRQRFCELVLNGRYQGIYVLFEKIKRDNNRVDISRLDSLEISGDDLTGGYIIKIDKRDGEEIDGWYSEYPPVAGTSFRIYYQYHYPRPDNIVPEQEIYIKSIFDAFENMMQSDSYDSPVTGYASFIDVSSFVDFFLLNEISKNVDGYRLSTYFHKDKDSDDPKLYIGPVWDFNLAFGNANYYDGWKTDGWQVEINSLSSFKNDGAKIPFYWKRLINDRNFLLNIVSRWKKLRTDQFSTASIHSFIDTLTAILDEGQQRNFERWPVLDTYVWPNYYVGGSYENEIDYLKEWIDNRLKWMDNMLLDSTPPDPVRNLRITDNSHSSITIAWDESGDNQKISGYDIFLDEDKVCYSNSFYSIIDKPGQSGVYQIEIKARDYAGNYSQGNSRISVTGLPESEPDLPNRAHLYQNYPNPFNASTTIRYRLEKSTQAAIAIYDLNGRIVKNLTPGNSTQSEYAVTWDGKDAHGRELSTGVYVCRLTTPESIISKKMILLR